MRSFLQLFRVTHAKRIVDPKRIKSLYQYWRVRLLINMYCGYAVFYFTRKSFTFITPALISTMHISKVDIGLIASLFYIIYGCSKFLSGILSDRLNARYFMPLGLFITGVANILFGLSSHLYLFLCFWLLNAFFQGWGWPPCAKLLTRWYSRKQRGRWWGVWNTCHNVGGALIPLIVGVSAYHWGWRAAMWIPGVIAIVMSVMLVVGLRDVPETLGLPPLGEHESKASTLQAESTLTILKRYVFTNRYIWLLALAYVLVYVVRTAINDWGAVYLTEHGYSLVRADSCLSFFEVGGFFGSLLAGWISDTCFNGMRGQTNVLFCFAIVFAVFALWALPGHNFFLHAACIFAIGFTVFGPQMLIGIAAAEVSHKNAAGASTGFVGLFAYLGAALSGYPIALVLRVAHWHGFFMVLIGCCIAATLLLACMWSVRGYTPAVMATDANSEPVGA